MVLYHIHLSMEHLKAVAGNKRAMLRRGHLNSFNRFSSYIKEFKRGLRGPSNDTRSATTNTGQHTNSRLETLCGCTYYRSASVHHLIEMSMSDYPSFVHPLFAGDAVV